MVISKNRPHGRKLKHIKRPPSAVLIIIGVSQKLGLPHSNPICTLSRLFFSDLPYRGAPLLPACLTQAGRCLPKLGPAPTHHFALTDKLCAELATVQREVDVKVHSVKSTLGCVHALEIGLQVLTGQIGGECDDFLDTCIQR